MQWLQRILPDLDSDFIIDGALRDFAAVYKYFAPAGVPMMGRSTCYRMAARVPLEFAQSSHPEVVSPSVARWTPDVVWHHVTARGALQRGNLTQGSFGTDARFKDVYSGPASCLWSLRSLVAAFALPDSSGFWQAWSEPLPVEAGDYRIKVSPPGWTVTGDRATGVVTLETGQAGSPPLESMSLRDRLLGPFCEKPPHPKNIAAKCCRARYVSTSPYTATDGAPE
jgi:hypothetical protein